MMKKKSFVVVVVTFFLIGYVALSAWQIYSDNMDSYQAYMNRKIESLQRESDLILKLSERGHLDLVENQLGKAKERIDLHIYILFEKETPILESNPLLVDQAKLFVKSGKNVFQNEDLLLIQKKMGPYVLVLGYINPLSRYKESFWERNRQGFLKDLVMVGICILLVVGFFFEDFKTMLNEISSHKSFGRVENFKTKEAQLFSLGLQAIQDNNNLLKSKYSLLDQSILPALKNELQSGFEPPYVFDAALVRLDINQFTQGFMSENRQEYLKLINDFFIEATALIGRYQGQVKEFLGDEVIFYFKGTQQASVVSALGCIRDLNDVAKSFEARARTINSEPLAFKSSVCFGKLLFSSQVNGFNISGEPLVESVRLLSEISDRKSNSLIMVAELWPFKIGDVTPGFKSSVQRKVKLKGYQDLKSIFEFQIEDLEWNSWNPFSDRQILENVTKLVVNTRSDQNWVRIFDLSSKVHSVGFFTEIVGKFNRTQIEGLNAGSFGRYLNLLHSTQEKAKQDLAWCRPLSNLTGLCPYTATRVENKKSICEVLERNFNFEDERLKANTIEALRVLMPNEKFRFLKRDLNSNRSLANAIVADSSLEMSKELLRELQELLQDPRPYYQSSGLYALRTILQELAVTAPQIIQTNPRLQGLVKNAIEGKVGAESELQLELLKKFWFEYKKKNSSAA